MRVAVVSFPGSLDDDDAAVAVAACGGDPIKVRSDETSIGDVHAVVLPGGFSYGDYLRCGAVAHRSPVMDAVRSFAAAGGPVLGICNGFQILCESGLLPGALLRNEGLRFVCRPVGLVIESTATPWTASYTAGELIVVPAKHGEGRYYADEDVLDELERQNRVIVRYAAGNNPNGSARDIAGVANKAGNVVGLMPHPEHAVDPELAGGTDGRGFFESVLSGMVSRAE